MNKFILKNLLKLVEVLIVLLIVGVYSVKAKAISASFGSQYSSTDTVATYTFACATPSCSLSFTYEQNLTVVGVNRSSVVFTISSLPVSSNAKYLTDSTLTLFGAYQLSLQQAPLGTSLLFRFICTDGISNTSPISMRVYVLGSTNFYNSGAIPKTTTIDYRTTVVSTKSSLSTIIGLVGTVDSGNSIIGPTFYSFYGPFQFSYNLATNSLGKTLEKMVLSYPNVRPTFISYGLNVAKSIYSSRDYQSLGYVILHSFQISTFGNPNTDEASLHYSHVSGTRFTDIHGFVVQNIQPETFICLCSSSGDVYTPVATSIVTSNSLTCKFSTLCCSYVNIVGKGRSIPLVSPSPSSTQEISMNSGLVVNTGSISSIVYYKINVPSGMILSLSDISLTSNTAADGNAYITINDRSSYSSEKLFVYSISQKENLSYKNNESVSKTIYVIVEPSPFSSSVTFLPRIELVFSYRFPIRVASSIVGFLFTVCSVIIVIVTLKRNSRNYVNIAQNFSKLFN